MSQVGTIQWLAARLARDVPVQDWHPVADGVHGTEVAPDATGLRRLVYELHQADGTVEYALLYTTLPAAEWSVGRLFAFYNERTTSEAFFCPSRHVYNIQTLRSRQFHAIYAFLRFVVLVFRCATWLTSLRDSVTGIARPIASALRAPARRHRRTARCSLSSVPGR